MKPVMDQRTLCSEGLGHIRRENNTAAGSDRDMLAVDIQNDRCDKMNKGVIRSAFGADQMKAVSFWPVVTYFRNVHKTITRNIIKYHSRICQ